MASGLIIEPYLADIVNAIDQNPIVQVVAPTGSGKSLGVPGALAKKYRILVSVPTRISATSLCNQLSEISDLKVGYAADCVIKYTNDDNVVYATSGHVRRKILYQFSHKRFLNFADVLILDESHTGSMDVTAILSYWKVAHERGDKIKLVLLSATPNDLSAELKPINIVVPVPTPYPVSIEYCAIGPDDCPYDYAFNLAIDLHKSKINGDFIIFVPGSAEAEKLAERLQFELEDEVVALPAYASLHSDDLKLIYDSCFMRKMIVATNVAESSITIDGLTVVIDTMLCRVSMPNEADVVCLKTTNISKDNAQQRAGRVGRTCPGKCYRLIGEERYADFDAHQLIDIKRLPLHNIVMEFLKVGLDPKTMILGAPEHKVVDSIKLLEMLKMVRRKTVPSTVKSIDGDKSIEVSAIHSSEVSTVPSSAGSTKGTTEVSTIPSSDVSTKYSSKAPTNEYLWVTGSGDFAPMVPLAVRNSAFLWKWITQGYPLYPGVVIASTIDAHSSGYFYIPRRQEEQSSGEYAELRVKYIQSKFSDWFSVTPLHTFINMWLDFCETLEDKHDSSITDPLSVLRERKRWSYKRSLRYPLINNLANTISQTYLSAHQYFDRMKLNTEITLFNVDVEVNRALSILTECYGDNKIQTGSRSRFRSYSTRVSRLIHPKSRTLYTFDRYRCISNIEKDFASCISQYRSSGVLPLASHEIFTSGRILGIIDIVVPAIDTIFSA